MTENFCEREESEGSLSSNSFVEGGQIAGDRGLARGAPFYEVREERRRVRHESLESV